MTGILAELCSPPSEDNAWQACAKPIRVHPDERTETWRDASSSLAIARSSLAWEGELVEADGCVVALDGWLDDRGDQVSDAHAIAGEYRRRGLDAARGLRGEFAFVLWDVAARRIVAGVDVLARRSLFYSWQRGCLVVSTRALAVLRHPRVPKRWDFGYLAHALGDLAAQPPEMTAFRDVTRLAPGHALSLEGERFVVKRVDAIAEASRSRVRRSEASYIEEFWALLKSAVARRTRRGHASLSLSGGLDSGCVAIAALGARDSLDAYTMVSHARPDLDERSRVALLALRFPELRVHHVFVDVAPAPQEPLVPDDPQLVAPVFARARMALYKAAAREGAAIALDGEGGDEVFDLCAAWSDLLVAGSVAKAVRYLRLRRDWRTIAWRLGVVPRMPRFVRPLWIARERRRDHPFPPWIHAEARRSPEVCGALVHYEAVLFRRHYRDRLVSLLSGAATTGALHAERLRARQSGVDLASPMLDRSLVDFAISLPPDLRLDPTTRKPFLRNAATQRLPEATVRAPKDAALYMTVLESELQMASLAASPCSPILTRLIDLDTIRALLAEHRRGRPIGPRNAMALYALLGTMEWVEQIEREFF